MPLKIYSSNHVETLQGALSNLLSAQPLASPFTPETIITPTYALARWLNLQLASDLGIAANINYLRPSQWFWQLASENLPELPEEDQFSRAELTWHIFDCLQSLPKQPVFETIRLYCDSDNTGIKTWQLAERLADSFDRYQWYRSEMVEDWSNGKESNWQACLWRQLLTRLGPHHRPYQVRALCDKLRARPPQTAERLILFAVSELPPLYLSVIQAIAPHCQLELFLHSPTDQYWADLPSQKQAGKQRLLNPESNQLFETGNELLSAWGRQGQIFQDLLLNADMVESMDVELYQPPQSDTLLESVQASVFEINQTPQTMPADGSIQVHVCHSAMRECQVLQDHLLDMLNEDESLQPEEILVMVPDISAYAASIESVFKHQNTSGVSCNLSDLSLAHEHPSAVSFMQLLDLPDSRFTRSEILGLLDNPSIRRQFGIDSEGHRGIVEFVNQSRVKWGIDGQHKKAFGLPAIEENTWQQARNRFFAGYAFSDHQHLWQNIAPLAVDDNDINRQLGKFWFFLDQLCAWKNRLSGERTAAEWRFLLNELLSEFLGEPESPTTSIQLIRDGINHCLPESETRLTPVLVSQLLQKQLYRAEQPGQLYSGGITFCGLRPMRNIPFKVICLLGMNRDAFPRSDKPAEFDVMKLDPRGGDPSYRWQDRYLMLETLLCCRQKLYISYTGSSLQDNSELPASTLLDELLDYMNRLFVDPSSEETPFTDAIRQFHPMQAYSPRQFNDGHFSYQKHWFDIGQQLNESSDVEHTSWPDARLVPIDSGSLINIEDLRRFLQDPLRYFFTETLGVRLFSEDLESDEETFELDGLQRWQLRQQLAHNHLQQVDDSLSQLLAEGHLPHGAAATSYFNELALDSEDWLQQLDDYRGESKQSLLIEIELGSGFHLGGRVGNYYPGKGLMTANAGRLKGNHLLVAWLDHLLLTASGVMADGDTTRLIATDQSIEFTAVDRAEAVSYLIQYCELYIEGRQRPLPVFPVASFEWAQQSDPENARKKVWSTWENRFIPQFVGDSSNAYISLVLRDHGLPPFDETEFAELAKILYTAALEHGNSHD